MADRNTPCIGWHDWECAWLQRDLRLLFRLFARVALVAPFFDGLEAFFAAVGALGGAFPELGDDQFEHGLLGAVAFAKAEAYDARVSAVALAEAGSEVFE